MHCKICKYKHTCEIGVRILIKVTSPGVQVIDSTIYFTDCTVSCIFLVSCCVAMVVVAVSLIATFSLFTVWRTLFLFLLSAC